MENKEKTANKVVVLKVKAYDLCTKSDVLAAQHQELRREMAKINKEIIKLEQGNKHGEGKEQQ